MNKLGSKLLGMLAVLLFIAIIPIVVSATNENISVVSTKNEAGEQEYIIYLKGYTDKTKTFKYALSNNANPEVMDFVYINSITDLGENQIAFLDAETYEKLSSQTIYMWAKDENENLILEGVQLDLDNSITKENIDSVETITKRITVEIADSEEDATEVRNEVIEGVEEIASVGYVKITEKDNKKATYYYEILKVSDSAECKTLMELAEKINSEYDEMDMYEKVQISEEFYDIYSTLVNEADWKQVKNMTVEQPEESVAGDKYVVFLKKEVKDSEPVVDVQFLTAYDDYKPNVVKEQKITQETAKLPITYDSIALLIILAVIVVALVVVYIRMKKVSKENEQE